MDAMKIWTHLVPTLAFPIWFILWSDVEKILPRHYLLFVFSSDVEKIWRLPHPEGGDVSFFVFWINIQEGRFVLSFHFNCIPAVCLFVFWIIIFTNLCFCFFLWEDSSNLTCCPAGPASSNPSSKGSSPFSEVGIKIKEAPVISTSVKKIKQKLTGKAH